MKYTYFDALTISFPDVVWKLVSSESQDEESFMLNEVVYPDSFEIMSGQAPSKTELEAEITRLQSEYDTKQYQRDRAAEYPPVTDYLDGIVKGDTTQVQAYIDACLAVKAKYPKPE